MKIKYVVVILTAIIISSEARARDYLRVVGSSTLFPFITVTAEEFARTSIYNAPVVESTGTGAGIKSFCMGANSETPDIVAASRRIKETEIDFCRSNGVDGVLELAIGYDAVVIANASGQYNFDFTRSEIFKLLSAYSSSVEGLQKNKFNLWSDINPAFPASNIEIYGPSHNTGTYESLINAIMIPACNWTRTFREKFPEKEVRTQACSSIRDDGKYVESGVNESIVIQKIAKNTSALGIFGYNFLQKYNGQIKGNAIAGVYPTYENIVSGKYILSRPLYIYIKEQHLDKISGFKEFLKELISDKAMGPEGYLVERGLVPPESEKIEELRLAIS